MIYVTSDLHGCYDEFESLLKAIDLTENDQLYILGDVLDRGPRPLDILFKMMSYPNMVGLLGNHEYTAMTMFELLANKKIMAFSHAEMEIFELWLDDGGRSTIAQWLDLTEEKQIALLTYLKSWPTYREIEVNHRQFILVHAGLGHFDPQRPLSSYSIPELLFERTDYQRVYFPTRFLVTGHTPTQTLNPNFKPVIFKENRHFAIDCGVVFGGRLACLCLDDLHEYYI